MIVEINKLDSTVCNKCNSDVKIICEKESSLRLLRGAVY